MFYFLILFINIAIIWYWQRYKNSTYQQPNKLWNRIGRVSIAVLSLLIVLGFYGGYTYYVDNFPLDEKRTEREMIKMEKAMVKYHSDTGHFPTSIDDLIRKNPTRKPWKTDEWNNEYRIISEGENVRLISSGADMAFETEDDIIIKPRH